MLSDVVTVDGAATAAGDLLDLSSSFFGRAMAA